MGVYFFLARRLSLSSEGHKSSPAIKVAIAAVALSVIVMMGAIAIVMGFRDEITAKVAGFNPHILLYPVRSDQPENPEESRLLTLTPSLRKIILSSTGVTDASIQVAIPAILKTSGDFKGVYLKSFTGKSLIDFISASIEEGKIPDYSDNGAGNQIIISRKVAEQLGLKAGQPIDTYFISDRLKVKRFKIAGIFNSHFDSYDDAYIFGDPSTVRELASLKESQGTSLSISVDDINDVDHYTNELNHKLLDAYASGYLYKLYSLENVKKSGAAYFQWLDMLNLNVVVILILMTIVACVTLGSGMLIMMVDKIRFIALMQALGATRKNIGKVFIYLAARIAGIGVIIGDVIAISILYIQQTTHFLPLDPDSYYIDFVPVKLAPLPILILNISVIAIIFILLWLPSRTAVKKFPAHTLSTE